MKVIIHDLGIEYDKMLQDKCDAMISADGKYAPCQGCFGCWTKHPAECFMKDSLKEVCRVIGRADELVIISENCYGAYSPAVKNVLDRSIATSTPMSTYRGKQMHHTLRYGKHEMFKVITYGDITPEEKATFELMAERNAINDGYEKSEVIILKSLNELEDVIV
ncbi:MAG: flavodoxin family protein [Lachnospiraceae bacterium]|nr:flavodoxin family protein [Lachnospiraceae bacterium]